MRPLSLLALLCLVPPVSASDEKSAAKSVEQIAEAVRRSVVVVTVTGRDGERQGLGTGFVVGDGLIATNLHVIGEARPITVELSDGKKHEVTAVHAFDRALDLAIVRIDAKGLTPLPLADSAKLKDGQPVVAVGNPQGLRNSVVSGVLSGQREIDGQPMLQIAIPIERGNSGGPLVDMEGRVLGVMTSKSLVTANLGFAVAVNSLKPMLAKPNTIAMSAWLTIGTLDPADWKPMLGARWRRRGGRIVVEEPGSGFGGRSYCLSMQDVPNVPYEVGLSVKLDDEGGAAGLIFHATDDGRHYGFYPTGGKLRLTRFDGPDVYSWKILEDRPNAAYRPGEWNHLKVRVEKGKLKCYVNDQLVFESDDAELTEGKIGLAKFRNTKAEFKQLQVAKSIAPTAVSKEIADRIAKEVGGLDLPPLPGGPLVDKVGKEGPAGLKVLRERAKLLEEQAVRLRRLAQVVHQKTVADELVKVLAAGEGKIDLLHAALLIARLDNDELDVDLYRREVERIAKTISSRLPKDADDKAKLAAMNKYLFEERGFHGSRLDYYNRSNSYLSEVLDDREGLPITLSVLYMDLGRRLGVKIEGVGLPGHFVVRHIPAKGEPQLIDVYDGGKAMSRKDAEKKVEDATGEKLEERFLDAVKPRDVVVRMLNNLLRIAESERDAEAMLRYLDTIVAVNPEAVRERGLRAMTRAQLGDRKGALEDLDWILDRMPEGIDLDAVRGIRRRVERE